MTTTPAAEPTPLERTLTQQGRSLSWLARRAGVSPSYASLMLRGQRPLTETFRARASEILGVPADLLFPEPPSDLELQIQEPCTRCQRRVAYPGLAVCADCATDLVAGAPAT